MATFLVTGGCGFIGSHLVDALLARGDAVRILDDLSSGRRENVPAAAELVVGDVTDAALVARMMRGAAGCFHLAAIASVARANEEWLATHNVNLGGTICVFEQAVKAGGVPVVYASSAAVYGDSPSLPLSETDVLAPLSAYGADKLGCELHARAAGLVHRLPTFGLRFFNVFGPRQDPKSPYSGVISIFSECARTGRPITIHGDGEQVRDFIHVQDVVSAMLRALVHAEVSAPVANVCSGRALSIKDLALTVARASGAMVDIVHTDARSGDIRQSVGDPARARTLLGLPEAEPFENRLTTLF